jgi:RNA polymerase sigma factor (sigma-70 family)
VARLLAAETEPDRDACWSVFLEEYNRLILHCARSLGGSHDAVMDRYAHTLEQLRRDQFRKLRGYAADGRGKFTTWLVVVVRRLCLDQVRNQYGRDRSGNPENGQQRRELADLIAGELDPDILSSDAASAEDTLRTSELQEQLNDAVERLEPGDRLLLRLRFQDEVPVAEIARISSLPSVFHVYRQLNRIYEELRKALRDAGVTDATP